MTNKILLLGSGELGKELVISLKRLGEYVVACDNYAGAPAMQVADEFEVLDMLDGAALDEVIKKHRPRLIVPEVEAIRTDRFFTYEEWGHTVVPSARAANYTMNRKLIRDLAASLPGVKTAHYLYATSLEDFRVAVEKVGMPCVVKPLMSSSGKGQSTVRKAGDIEKAWEYALEGSRGDLKEVIVEEFIPFESEITLLTVTQHNGPILFCPPIGHRQERGDYRESWQPAEISDIQLREAQVMAAKVTAALTGAGIWGVEFFLTKTQVYFSELSPRPHDTGMVTLAGTQNLSEFELHARAILGLPIPEVRLERNGVSAVVLATGSQATPPQFSGISEVLQSIDADVRVFGKPTTRPYRRMAVVLKSDTSGKPMEELITETVALARKISVK